jgi:hypothetical protein
VRTRAHHPSLVEFADKPLRWRTALEVVSSSVAHGYYRVPQEEAHLVRALGTPQTVPFGMLLRKSLNINMLSGRHERLPVKSLVAQYGKLTYTVGKD